VKKIDQLMSTFEPPDDAKDDRRRPAAYSTKYTGTDRKILRPMATLHNEITIDAPIEKIWTSLSNIEELEKYDPTVKRSTALTEIRSGQGAARKVEMKDGKNWFEEKVTKWVPNEALTYELTACSFPVQGLSHAYSFERVGRGIKVKQVMSYRVKFGLLGKVLDWLMIRKQSDAGVKKFMAGLKSYAEAK
jgi:uncharacterized protein YndB with AHSA1/START domain